MDVMLTPGLFPSLIALEYILNQLLMYPFTMITGRLLLIST